MRKFIYTFLGLCGTLVFSADAYATAMTAQGWQSPQRAAPQGFGNQNSRSPQMWQQQQWQQQQQRPGPWMPGGQPQQQRPHAGQGQFHPQQQPQRQGLPNQQGQAQQFGRAGSGQGPRSQEGGFINMGLSRQYSQYQFEMNTVHSVLNWSDVAWNVLDVQGGYRFANGWMLEGGAKYGVQAGSGLMTDDDITRGGLRTYLFETGSNIPADAMTTRVLSLGETGGGRMMGMHAGVGMTDRISWGNVRITPSVGYRVLNHRLQTFNNHGLAVTGLESQCSPISGGPGTWCPGIVIFDDGSIAALPRLGPDDGFWYEINPGATLVSSGETGSFFQSGNSHIYDVTWGGPYVAVTFDMDLSPSNFVDLRVELGLPGYDARGDQPYRLDWAPGNGVRDNMGLFGAVHLGLSANWITMFNPSWGLSFGLTYDYYRVRGADATTNLNEGFFMGILNDIFDHGVQNGTWTNDNNGWNDMLDTNHMAGGIADIYDYCGGWSCTFNNEVNAFFRNIGFRVGVVGMF